MKQNNVWATKNERRKEKRGLVGTQTRREYNEGRKNRHIYSYHGAFGNLGGRMYNFCSQGTFSAVVKKDED